ncbi:MAG: radical SAM protein [Phycisphaerae bacterium]|nr:radical SAM protein [Phycisphaerae bacterium]
MFEHADAPTSGPPPLRMLFWETTPRCNLDCAHCRRTGDGAADELSLAEAGAMFADAATLGTPNGADRPVVVFSGGEPLLRDDWEALASAAQRCGLPTALATNGTLIDDALAGRIAAAGFRRVAVSIDGADAETHDGLRGRTGAFNAALAGLSALRRAGQSVQINTTITRRNVAQLDTVLAMARSIGAEAVHLFLLVPVGCGAALAETQQLPPDHYERVLDWLCDRRDDGETGLELRATCAPHYHRVARQRGLPVRDRGCLGGRAVVFVGQDGTVRPCGYLPIDCGNVRRAGLAALWRDAPVLTALRDTDRLGGACGRCAYRDVCGGCRARAYAATGDFLAADPACSHGQALEGRAG